MKHHAMIAFVVAVGVMHVGCHDRHAAAQTIVRPGSQTIVIHIHNNANQPARDAVAKFTAPDIHAPEFNARQPYPTSPSFRNWNMGGLSMTTGNMIRHLMGEIGNTQHGGRFELGYLEYLASLPDGNARLRALHSDDHDNRVRWDIVNGDNVPKAVGNRAATRRATMCPGGYCPR